MTRQIFQIFLWTLFTLVCTNLVQVQAIPPLQTEEPRSILHKPDVKYNVSRDPNSQFTRLRLPDTIVPSYYDIFIQPIIHDDLPGLTKLTAPGYVTITFTCTQNNVRNITLHNNGPNITHGSIKVTKSGENVNLNIANFHYDWEEFKHFFIVEMNEDLEAGQEYEIYIEFVAPIPDKEGRPESLDGLYYGSYWDAKNEVQRSLAATQLEAYHCRQIFPSFDEPHLKARFRVEIGRLATDNSLTNTELVETVALDGFVGWEKDIFAPSPIMPTYLLAIMVSDFNFTEADPTLYPGKIVRTYAAPHLIEKGGGKYAADKAARILAYLETEYNHTYPIVKMDSAALPNFSSGAMENYGLNNYQIRYLLYFEGETVESSRYTIDSILGHELAHQWFGNLVSCAWWSQLWLNEGFATYVSYLAVKAVGTEFNADHRIINEAVQPAMRYDVTQNSHPIVNNALTPPEIDSIFSTITYEKGGSIIRMMAGFLGDDTLRKGLRAYLKKMEWQGAYTDDLWDSLTQAGHEDGVLDPSVTMKDIMDSWTLQKGYPLLRVSKAGENRILISQERFSQDGRRRKRDLTQNELWYIPVSFVTAEDPNFVDYTPELWIESNVAIRVHDINTNDWLLLNPDAIGFYRVMYDPTLLNLIRIKLTSDPSAISPISRSQLLDDQFNLAFNSYIQIESALDMTILLANEDQRVVWTTFFTNLRKSYDMFSSTPTFESFRNYLLPFLDNALNLIGLEQNAGDIGDNVVLRNQILDWACPMGSLQCKSYTTKLFTEWDTTPNLNPVPIDIQRVIYCSAVSDGGFERFDQIFQKYRNEKDETQRGHLLSALGCTKEISLLELMLEYALNEVNGFHKADTTVAMQRVAANSNGRRVAFNFLREKLDNIGNLHPNFGPVTGTISTLSTYWNTDSELSDLNAWIEDLKLNPDIPENVINSLSNSARNIDTNIKWMKDHHEHMDNWFISHKN